MYIKMELCETDTLQDWLKMQQRDKNRAHTIFREVVDAVCYLHKKGLIHRDIKVQILFYMPQ